MSLKRKLKFVVFGLAVSVLLVMGISLFIFVPQLIPFVVIGAFLGMLVLGACDFIYEKSERVRGWLDGD